MTRMLCVLALVAAGCSDGGGERRPKTARTTIEPERVAPVDARESTRWIAQLDDPDQVEHAVTELEALCDPEAAAPLGRAWQRHDQSIHILHVMIRLAKPLTPEEAVQASCDDYAVTGRPATWERVLPFLREAVAELDTSSQHSIDNAVAAADAIGMAGLPEGIDVLIEMIARRLPAKDNGQRVRLVAVAALARFEDPRVIPALAGVIRADLWSQPPQLIGAAINALGERRSLDALPVLLEALYRSPLFFRQVQRALVQLGPEVAPELRAILRGEHAAINALIADQRLDRYCGDDGKAAAADCKPVAARDFYAAMVLGALHDQDAVPDLVAALAQPRRPAYYADWNPGPLAQSAVLEALRQIGASTASRDVLAVIADRKGEARLRAVAARVYGIISTRGEEHAGKRTGLAVLATIVADKKADPGLRLAAAEALGNLADDAAEIAAVSKLASTQPEVAAAAIAKVELAARCAGEVACLMATFEATGDDRAVVVAQIERAVLELARLGENAADQVAPLLAQIAGPWIDERIVSDAVLLALPRLAPRPCPACRDGLDAVREAASGLTSRQALSSEASLLKAYFVWAGE